MKRSTPKADLSAVVVAAGQSQRFRHSLNEAQASLFRSKALIPIQGRPLILQTLERLNLLNLHEIVLVVSEQEIPTFEAIIEPLRPTLPTIRLCVGGASRKESVYRGLKMLDTIDRVCIHDGARPFLSADLLQRLNAMSLQYPAAVPALAQVDTVKEIAADGSIIKTLDRSRLVRIQTPQFFRLREILSAHEHFANSPEEFTDDAALFEALNLKVMTVAGDAANIKVTTVHDLASPAVLGH